MGEPVFVPSRGFESINKDAKMKSMLLYSSTFRKSM